MKSSPLSALSVPTLLLACALLAAAPPLAAQLLPSLAPNAAPDYPLTRQVEHVDTYHGQRVADPYRWLEDDRSAETAAWVAAQNRVTDTYFERIGFRADLQTRLTQLFDHPRRTVPERRGNQLYYRANTGLQNQNVVWRQAGPDGKPELVFDPNTLAADGTTRLGQFVLQPSGRHAAYTLSQAGSDWQELRVLDLATRTPLPERLQWVKVSGIAWAGDGFFYSRYPAPAAGTELSARNDDHRVYFHRIGTPQSADELVYADAARPQRFHTVATTEDGRWAVLSVSERGSGRRGNALFVRDLRSEDKTFRPLVPDIGDASFSLVEQHAGRLLLRTDDGAPNGRIIAVDPARPGREHWQTVVAERADEALRGASLAGGRLFVLTLKDVSSRAYVHMPDGRLEREIALPGLGTASGFGGQADDTGIFYSYTSFDTPPVTFRYDVASGQSSVHHRTVVPGYDPADYVTRQVFFTSRDGTRVPMFLVHRKGLVAHGLNPTLLYGYGGFGVSQLPAFSAQRLALLEQGVVFALANLRGGAEYGRAWHQAGTKLKKQNTFDDFIAAAEWLHQARITSPEKLAIQGGSNGGLLVGAVINQRPELFAAAVPQVGVMDMLRFHKFTIGWNWIADYGSSDNADEFKALLAISPLHNIRPGQRYPAVLVTTADHDDRVVPAHSFKYTATLQSRADRMRPVLIRVDTRSGHGASNTSKQIASAAEVYAFLLHTLGVTPRWAM